MFQLGADPYFLLAKSDLENTANGWRYMPYYPQESTAPEQKHTHDHMGGGEISYNIWHSAMLHWNERPVDGTLFHRFTIDYTTTNEPIEAAEGILQNTVENAIKSNVSVVQNTYTDWTGAANKDIPRYLPVWQFIYSNDLIAARRSE